MNIKFLWELLFSIVGTHELHTAFGANLFKVETAHMLEAYWVPHQPGKSLNKYKQ